MQSSPETISSASFLASGGEMARRMREFDWSQHPLGPPEDWPQSLKVVIRIMLTSRFAMWLGWGPDYFFFFNDAYRPTLGMKQDRALGAPATEVWAEIWNDIGPRAESVVRTGEATWDESLLLFLERSGYPEETYHTFSYSPVPDDDGSVGGMLCVVSEETDRVIGERRLALLRKLGADLAGVKVEDELFEALHACLSERSEDLPFALVYLLAADGKSARLACAHHLAAGTPPAPERIALGEPSEVWPATLLFEKGEAVPVNHLATRFAGLPSAPWDKPPRDALLVPIAQQGQEQPAGFLVAGLNPYRPLSAAYRGFLDLLAGQIAAGLASARTYDAERKRAEALAEIDRAKTTFFSNVSHEFRTPLTLMLGPLEEIATQPESEAPDQSRQLASIAHRNGLRLLKLVNSLLDFSRLEAGRVQAHFEPTDLATYTAELASSFRSAMEKAGLAFVIECPPLPEPVYIDREMWEKIVLNLLSNAFKFTLHGEVRVTVQPLGDAVELAVRDTGTGIPDEAMAHLFERFYRVRGAQGRTHEGTGIGLALVHELVKLHGGTVRVESQFGTGSVVIVTIPRGLAHLPAEQCAAAPSAGAHGSRATAFVAEALRWLPDHDGPGESMPGTTEADGEHPPPSTSPRPRVLLADDNSDMRAYIARLLSPRFEVTAVTDGQAALEAALDEQPDLVLTDVMMPGLDGFGLLREMRADPALQSVPVILLSARAGEEARTEGLNAGADDYLTKPFHARELFARVNSTITLARVRAEALAREAELRAERTEILESMDLAFMALDAEFRIVYLNAEAIRTHGLAQQKYLGRAHWEAFPESVGTAVETNFRHAMTGRVPVRFEHFYEPWEQWFEVNAYPMTDGRLGVFFREITARKRTEMLLLEQNRLLEIIATGRPMEECLAAVCATVSKLSPHARACVLLTDATRQTFTRCIAADFPAAFVESLTGSPVGDLASGTCAAAVISGRSVTCADIAAHGPWSPAWRDQCLAHGILAYRSVPVPDADGLPFASVALCLDEAREPNPWEERLVEFSAYVASITLHRDRVSQALRVAKEAAEAANRSKDRFLAVLSHELRTPLTPVLLAVASLEADPDLRSDVRADLAMMKRNIELETKLIDDLLDLNRIVTGKLPLKIERVDLNEAVRHVCATCSPPLRDRGIRLDIQCDAHAGWIAADPARLQQVLWNVLKNAIKFTPDHGTISVTTTRLPGARCAVRVQDSGIGIPAEALPHIFNAFEQGDASVTRQFGGLGLGLAISKALVEMHHGSIRAESAGPGQGATFIIELPGEAPLAPAEAARPGPAETGQAHPIRLLLVEDHADTARTFERLLRGAGFAVSTVSDVASATAAADRETFDVLVSDLGLPDGTGYDIMGHIRAKRPLPGIAMSGYGMEEDVRRSREAGFTEHLVKPIDVPQLLAAIRRAIAARAEG